MIAILAALAVSAAQASAAACTNTTSSGGTTATCTATVMTWSFTNTAGTLLVCGVQVGDGNTTATSATESITYATVSMGTQDVAVGGNSQTSTRIWHLVTPATGANNVVFTTSASGVYRAGGCISFTGQDATTPVRGAVSTFQNVAGTTASVAASPTPATGNIVVAYTGSGSTGTTWAAINAGTMLWNTGTTGNANTAGDNAVSGRWAGTGSALTVGFTIPSDFWTIVALEVCASGGCAAASGPAESGMRGFWGLNP